MNGDHSIPADFRGVIEECAIRATEETAEGAPEYERFRVISDEVGIFLYILARSTWRTRMSDMGGWGGAASSIIWLAGAANETDGEVTAWETNPRRFLKLQNCLSRARLAPNVELLGADPLWDFRDDTDSPMERITVRETEPGEPGSIPGKGSDLVVASLLEPDWIHRLRKGWDLLDIDGLLVLTDTLQGGGQAEAALSDFFKSRLAATVSFPLGEGVLIVVKLSADHRDPDVPVHELMVGQKANEVLEEIQERNRMPGAHLMAIPPATGRFLWTLVYSMQAKNVLEIGASAGYSGTWLASALKLTEGSLTTMDHDPKKVSMARESYDRAGVGDVVEILEGDAHEIVPTLEDPYDLVFLDCDKKYYQDLLEPILWRLKRGGLLVADNVISHGEILKGYVDQVQHHPCLASVTVPVGSGEETTMVL